jgi:glycerol uptake facilitator-like aquaporin
MPHEARLVVRCTAEFVGTALLLVAVVGSAIMGTRLFDAAHGLTLLANSLATGATLASLILTFGAVSGAHFNPAVSLALALDKHLPWRDVSGYLAAQLAGALTGVAAAHLMFDLPLWTPAAQVRAGAGLVFSECLATFGLVMTIAACSKHRPAAVPAAVATYIVGAYWFSSSTSFANPAVTVARALTDTFTGIRMADVAAFVAAQLAGAAAATLLVRWMATPVRLPATTVCSTEDAL